jgi:class 3 adenylate cyclase
MTRRTEQMAVLFADISDSAYFYETFGDDRARQIVLNCLDVLEAVVTERGGRVVDRIGDELMCTFPSADTTAEAAVELQEKVHKARLSDRLPANVSFRVGFHFGPVILDGDNIFGETVYIAKRVSRLAKGGQILTTGETLDALETKSEKRFKFIETTSLKGKSQQFHLHEVTWGDPLGTAPSTEEVPPEIPESVLHLQYEDRQITLGRDLPAFTIGRGERSGLVVNDEGVSRLHARIEYRKGYFVLLDMSSNGTEIIKESGEVIHVHRDELRLSGNGTIGLGAKSDRIINFQCHTKLPSE